jgi:hypothetical protein
MEAPYTVEIKCSDASGKEFVLFRNSELSYEALVGVQGAIADALKELGRVAVEAKKQK